MGKRKRTNDDSFNVDIDPAESSAKKLRTDNNPSTDLAVLIKEKELDRELNGLTVENLNDYNLWLLRVPNKVDCF